MTNLTKDVYKMHLYVDVIIIAILLIVLFLLFAWMIKGVNQ
ncbi:MAG TPA: hypothetical protein VJC00_01305 [Candidatus Nanoarchaeia archaeon]|nr:hypothetical protein [Candidatus Nanoarchaeia archaeon]